MILDGKRAIDEAKLTRKQRLALHLFFIEGLTQVQSAEEIGISQPSLKERIDNAVGKIASSQGYEEESFKEWAEEYYSIKKREG